MQLTRDFRIDGAGEVTFGLFVYNILDHPNFANPPGSLSSSALGRITATVTLPTSNYRSFQSGTVS